MSNEIAGIANFVKIIKIDIKGVSDKVDELDKKLSDILNIQYKKEGRQMLQDSPDTLPTAEYK